MDSPSQEPQEAQAATPPEGKAGIPLWKKVALIAAALFVVVGLVLKFTGGDPQPAVPATGETAPGETAPGMAGSLVATGPQSPSSRAPAGEVRESSDWSPLFLKGGFGFFAGFCIGAALRTFFKISTVVVGIVLLALLGLQYFGWIQVDWSAIGERFDGVASRIGDEFRSFHTFVTGSLPSASLSGLGLFAGFKKG